ncbi:hypothetical protein GWI33_015218 [Rhynchophorus ferrugineus]|uniref:Reverse transcriptase domain-containing protein n=1 Tax=Rhynchophorus ferrugineus TaxID=354439 RepID=A0A834I5G2_RHYFE|nr:hypothetical protein GWI33_015218 [Rhynchophorus ferrugineus]
MFPFAQNLTAGEEEDRGTLLHTRQFGFSKGKPTIDALILIEEVVALNNSRAYGNRGMVALLSSDVRNAFNSDSWNGIVQKLRSKKIDAYLMDVVQSYLSSRYVEAETVRRVRMWFTLVDLGEGTKAIAYANDLAILVRASSKTVLECRLARAADVVSENLRCMARQKRELIILPGRRQPRFIQVLVEGHQIVSKDALKYMGVWLDRGLRMTTHVLTRIILRVGGSGASEKRLLTTTHYEQVLERVNRRLAIRVTEAVFILAGMPPIKLTVEERTIIYKEGKETRTQARQKLVEGWQENWNMNCGWASKFVGSLQDWLSWEVLMD